MRKAVSNSGYDRPVSVGEDRDVRKLQARISAVERDVASIARDLAPGPQTVSTDAGPVNRDARWHCNKCGYLLGFYDTETDILRTRYKEHIVFLRCGADGWVQVVCRGCSEVNTAHGSPEGEAADQGEG